MLSKGETYLMTLWRTTLILALLIIRDTYEYDVILQGNNDETLFPVFINFTLLPVDAWVYVIQDVWSDSIPAKFDPVRADNGNEISPDETSVSSIWQGAVSWEKSSHSLRLDARVPKLISSWPLTVIIEAKSLSMSLVSLIPVTIHIQTAEKKLLTKSPMVADYPHIIQSYQSRKTCMGSRSDFMMDTTTEALLNLSYVLPYFVRNNVGILHSGVDPGKALLEMRENSLWATEKFCKSQSQQQPAYHQFIIKYQVPGTANLAEQAVDLLFHVQGEENIQVAKTRHRRKHRKTRAVSLSFASSSYTVFVTEEQSPPVFVAKMNITTSKPVRFSLIALIDSRSQPLFSIGLETGIIQTEAQLDRESKSEHLFRVTASQIDKLATATTTLTVRVNDINDYTPTFEKNDYVVELSENVAPGTIVVTVRATDYDAGVNGDVTYSVITGDHTVFEIDEKNGVITTRKPLDRETLQEHTLYVQAQDQGHGDQRKSSVAKITIKVLDENDWSPQFINDTCNIEIREDAVPQLPIAQLEAVDYDTGSNAQISYSIVSGNPNGQFILDQATGNLRVAAPGLDFETQQAHRLVIRAQDFGSPPRSNTTVCYVKVIDVNDGQPKFGSGANGYSVALAEDVLPGHAVIQTRAYDSDEGLQGQIMYSLRNHSANLDALPFAIDAESGWITTSVALDREKKDRYVLVVEARDLGTPPQSASVSVHISVLDVNDNGPKFEQRNYNISLSEGALQGTQICAVRAIDLDLNARLTYQFVSGNEDFRFNIINQNVQGIILLAKTVNYRQEQKTMLTVEVMDEMGKSDRATVTIHILAANLHRPTFLNAPFRVQIRENVPVGFTLLDLEALDEDVGENGRIIYSMNDFTDTFQLNASTGRLSTRKLLDRETVPMYTIHVTATDKGVPPLADVTEVLVELLDINDMPPVWFPQSMYSVAVNEDLKPRTSILQVSATDPDFGSNGFVYYTFDGGNNANGTFTVDYALGTVRTNAVLDREKTAEYELVVIAVDRGEPSQSSSATISVKVIDVNDNAPVFPEEILTYYVAENATIGSAIGEISATDPDENANAVVEYSIVGGPDASSFALVTRSDGRPPLLSNLIELDHEGQKCDYKLIIRASSAHLQTDVSVVIVVTDVNDHAPVLRDFTIVLNSYGSRNFPYGVIGKVPAMDRDATAQLEYTITAGNKHNLLGINPGTGEISLSATLNSDVGYSANFTVEVTDGLNTVSAVCTLMTIPVDQEMITNSVTLRVANMTARDILEPSVFHGITQSLAYICVCSPEAVFVFSIVEESESRIPIVNITFASKASLTSPTYMSTRVLKERLFAMRETLYNMTSMEILPFSDEVCNREPCSHFEVCSEVQKFGSAGSFLTSSAMLFRSTHPVTTFDCKCPSGFTGMIDPDSCDTEINLCYSKPCGRNGTCHSTEGSYHCTCEEGFYGSKCEMDHRLVGCSDMFCKGGATCSSSISTGLHCAGCPYNDQYRTDLCELTTRSFSRSQRSYVVFPGIRARNRFVISVSLSTTHRSGLIFYNGQFVPGADFISLELVNGSARFSLSLGQDTATVLLPAIIADGDWHRLEISYSSRAARITVDDCDYALSLEHGRELDYHCAAATTLHLDPYCSSAGTLCNRFLDLSGPFYIGGLPADYSDMRIGSHPFEGCIRNFEVDGKLTDMNDHIHQHGTSPGCPAKSDFCGVISPCQNGGSCLNIWNGRVCNCLPGYGGSDCSEVLGGETFGFDGDGYMLVVLSTMLSDSLNLKFEFRPNRATGALVAMMAKEHAGLTVRLEEHHIVVDDNDGSSIHGETFVNANRMYALSLLIQNGHVTVLLGGKKELEITLSRLDDDIGYAVLLGGKEASPDAQRRMESFHGCIRQVYVSGRLVSPTFRSNVQNGCADINRNCATSPCPSSASECKEVNGQFKCVCKRGFVGKQCKEVCSFEPCVNGVCMPSKEALHGYQCHCFENFTGLYCDKMVPQTCASDWWGYPLCGPCNCDVSKGFDPRCDQKDGTCRCKHNFYRLPGSDRCHECGCYPLGSLSDPCNDEGQCQCREGVKGKRCEICVNSQNELMEDVGCQRVYGACPRAVESGVWWDRTPFGMSTVQSCPGNSAGSAIRSCDKSTQVWSVPDLGNCSSLSFNGLHRLMLEHQEGILELTPHVLVGLIHSLRSALNTSLYEESLHLKDLSMAVNVTKMIQQHEIQQSGMNLTHRMDKNFLLDLVESVSLILDIRNRVLWESLEHFEQVTPSQITHIFLQHLKTIATHLESIQMSPFEVFTRNLRIGVSRFDRSVRRRSTHQNMTNRPFAFPANIPGVHNRVTVKLERIGSRKLSSEPLYYAEFTDLSWLLSLNRKTRHSKSEFDAPLSSAFFFGTIPNEESFLDVTYEFVLPVQPYLLSAHCVSWNFQTNKWTNDKCSFAEWEHGGNLTLVRCSCQPNMLVTVLSASSANSIFRSVFPIFLFSTVILALTLLLNLFTFVLLLAIRSNNTTICIAENLVLTAFFMNVTFLLSTDFEWDVLICKILAAVLHYWVLAKFSWNLAQAINLLKYSSRSYLDGSSKSCMKLHLLLGYGLPVLPVAVSVALQPEGYGADDVCWMHFGHQMLLGLILPVTMIVMCTLTVIVVAHCKAVETKKHPFGQAIFEMRHKILVCTTLSMFFVAGLSVAIVALSFGMTALGYVFPILCFGEAIFMLIYLCIKVPEALLLRETPFVWLLRKNLDKLSSKKRSRTKDVICDTYQNPGLAISNSTTYHKATQPDKDIVGSIGRCSVNSSFSRSVKSRPEDLIDNLNATYTSFHRNDEADEDTISVHSSSSSAKRYCSSARESNLRSPKVLRMADRSNSSLSTFGPPVSSWNSLPHSARSTKRNNIPDHPVTTTGSPKLASTFATFRPSSRVGRRAEYQIVDAAKGEASNSNNLTATGVETAKTMLSSSLTNGSSKQFVTLDYVETGTAV